MSNPFEGPAKTEKDPYALIGVPKSASVEEIRKAYKRLAKELHPDVRPNDPAAAERFKLITAAFNLLTDEPLRSRFDRGEIDMDGNQRTVDHPFSDLFRDGPMRKYARREWKGDPQKGSGDGEDIFSKMSHVFTDEQPGQEQPPKSTPPEGKSVMDQLMDKLG